MCLSRLHRVVRTTGRGWVEVEAADGTRSNVSLLALEGTVPVPGEWLTVHSGYAVDRVDAREAESVVAELRRGLDT